MTPQVITVWALALFGLFIAGVSVVFVLDVFWNGTTGIFTSGSYGANITTNMVQGIYNIFAQVPNVGKIAGISMILGVFALMGYGGYMAYNKLK